MIQALCRKLTALPTFCAGGVTIPSPTSTDFLPYPPKASIVAHSPIRQRQEDRERRALAGFAVHLDRAGVGFDDPLADGEPEARALFRMRARIVRPVETLEDVRLILWGNADPLIGDRQPGGPVLGHQIQFDSPAFE